ncbi:DedA family protein [Mesobacillus selenatarsenatis]|uniref:Alkaline phosphatase like protein n=1 Tax=Mesobacillus selenatarsenatis (strain DSM 18680 / JCM 14380 / FERM P-15431 / SF-1) TaxID=1321606 RepID=A0A0A8X5X9_MESS1|nr:DedA family protein [Mesobacillus selenatarsenatis]GAM14407.1 alkaline phosphatase like protein [Mesobacillus selenatarsenatis SF-1]
MDLELVINIIEDNGYLGLFLWLWFGVFVIPVPNEVILMTVGLASSKGALNPILAFLVTYMGISAAFTSSYLLGRIIGTRLLRVLGKKKRFANSIESAMKLMEKYHAFSLSLSCFAPGVRYLLPLLYGFSRLPFKTFAIFAYSGAFVWVSIIFVLGYLFGDKMDIVMKYNKEFWLVVLAFAMISIIFVYRRRKIRAAAVPEEVILQEGQQK